MLVKYIIVCEFYCLSNAVEKETKMSETQGIKFAIQQDNVVFVTSLSPSSSFIICLDFAGGSRQSAGGRASSASPKISHF